MDIEFVIKCSKCKKLLPLDHYDNRYSVWSEDKPQVMIKKKCCRDCLIQYKIYMEVFTKKHNVSSSSTYAYYYK
jgi:hypothetical protein